MELDLRQLDFMKELANGHPFYFAAASFAFGMAAPKLWNAFFTNGIPWAVKLWLATQRKFLKARGLSDEQISAIQKGEAAVLSQAAAEVEKDDPNT